MLHLIAHWMGLDSGSGPIYLAWSGFGSDLGEFAIIGGLVATYRKHACHVDRPRFCWRPGTHAVVGTPFRTCSKHHPTVPARVTAEHIEAAHNEAGGGTP